VFGSPPTVADPIMVKNSVRTRPQQTDQQQHLLTDAPTPDTWWTTGYYGLAVDLMRTAGRRIDDDAPPVVLRPTGVDRLRLTGTVGTACALRVDSAGATVVQPGHDGRPANWAVRLDVAAGACLRWTPQPTVVCRGADFRTSLHATLDPDSTLLVREVLVLGRSDESGGRCAVVGRTGLSGARGGRPGHRGGGRAR